MERSERYPGVLQVSFPKQTGQAMANMHHVNPTLGVWMMDDGWFGISPISGMRHPLFWGKDHSSRGGRLEIPNEAPSPFPHLLT